jgi:hypothetical protein
VSRIRSVHPGLWTDERFASLSAFARLLFIGLWNECDDQGSFEWSALKMKMRLLPADPVDAAPLLDELTAAGCVMPYEAEGRRLGAVRNFCRYQRPKKPNSTYPQPPEVLLFVDTKARSTRDGSEPVGNRSGTGGEKPRQRKEEGGRMETLSNTREVGSAAAKRGSRLPKDFEIPAEWIAWATTEGGLSSTDADRQAKLFVDHWPNISGKGGVKIDWLATWRNWCRRAQDFGRRPARAARDREYLGI